MLWNDETTFEKDKERGRHGDKEKHYMCVSLSFLPAPNQCHNLQPIAFVKFRRRMLRTRHDF
jgi:hypothetical protein